MAWAQMIDKSDCTTSIAGSLSQKQSNDADDNDVSRRAPSSEVNDEICAPSPVRCPQKICIHSSKDFSEVLCHILLLRCAENGRRVDRCEVKP